MPGKANYRMEERLMKYLLITSHPYKGSFNNAIAEAFSEAAAVKGHRINTIDLVADGFNPVMDSEDLRLWREGKSDEPLVEKYQQAVEEADTLVFPFPVWWGLMPAVLKGFCDKVLTPGWAYNYGMENGKIIDGVLIGRLDNKTAIVITTMEMPEADYNRNFNNPVENAFIKNTLELCGIKVSKFIQIDRIGNIDNERAKANLEKIKGLVE